jgi:hypothetical protein
MGFRRWICTLSGWTLLTVAAAAAPIEHTDTVSPPPEVIGMEAPTLFANAENLPEITFSHPSNWIVAPNAGRAEKYWQVLVLGPRNPQSRFSATLVVRRMPVAAPKNLQSLLDYRKQQREGGTAQNVRQSEIPLLGGTAIRTEYTAVVPLPAESKTSQPTPLSIKEAAFSLGGVLFEVTFQCDARDAETHAKVFEDTLASLKPADHVP